MATAKKTVEGPKKEVWFFESETDQTFGIETFLYENGGCSKRVKLKDGKEAVCRLLKGKDRVQLNRITNGEAGKMQDAITALSTTIDGKAIVLEDLDNMWFNDYTKVQMMAGSINFL